MTNIYSKQITLESVNEITNWVEPLAKVYERQINQIDRQHEYLRERDKQAEAADPGVTALNTFKNILEFGGAAAKLYHAHKGAQAKKDAEYQANFDATTTERSGRFIQEGRYLESLKKKYQTEKNDILVSETQGLIDALKKRATDTGAPDVALELEKASPRNVILQNEVFARRALASEGNEGRVLQQLKAEGNQTLIDAYNNLASPDDKAKFINNQILKRLDYLQLSDEAKAELLSDGLKRASQTTRGVNAVRTASAVSNAEDIRRLEAINSIQYSNCLLYTSDAAADS